MLDLHSCLLLYFNLYLNLLPKLFYTGEREQGSKGARQRGSERGSEGERGRERERERGRERGTEGEREGGRER